MNQTQTITEYMAHWIKQATFADSVEFTALLSDIHKPNERTLTVTKRGPFTSNNVKSILYYLSACMTEIEDNAWIIQPLGSSIEFTARVKTTMKDGFNTLR